MKVKIYQRNDIIHYFWIRLFKNEITTYPKVICKQSTNFNRYLLHNSGSFHPRSLFFSQVENLKLSVENTWNLRFRSKNGLCCPALELFRCLPLWKTSVFHRGRQRKSSRAGQQQIFWPKIQFSTIFSTGF